MALTVCRLAFIGCLLHLVSKLKAHHYTYDMDKARLSPEMQKKAEEMREAWYHDYFRESNLTQKEQDYIRGVPDAAVASIRRYLHRHRSKRQADPELRVRREYRSLKKAERNTLKAAMDAMHANIVDVVTGRSEYDIFVSFHQFSESPGAHSGAAFLPWHREYLKRFEDAMVMHEPTVSLPYWDSSLDAFLPNPTESQLWTKQRLGNNDGVVDSGLAANWNVLPTCGTGLTRDAGGQNLLFDDDRIQYVLDQIEYSGVSCSNDCFFENVHGLPHVFVGGQMSQLLCSPSDPIFWMHHAFIDCIWEEFRQTSQLTDRELDYPTSGVGNPFFSHLPTAEMLPFGPMTNIDGLSDEYTTNVYTCAPRPVRCNRKKDCGRSGVWCDESVPGGRCKATIQKHGDCTDMPDDACNGNKWGCVAGTCTKT